MLSPINADDTGFRAALCHAGLPIDDLDAEAAACFALVDDSRPVAYGGIAGTGGDRLLRSVVVPDTARHAGIGSRIVALLEEEARREGAERLWLLTNDAAGFFARIGWRPVDRTTAPDAIRRSQQFASLCPASATLMVRDLAS